MRQSANRPDGVPLAKLCLPVTARRRCQYGALKSWTAWRCGPYPLRPIYRDGVRNGMLPHTDWRHETGVPRQRRWHVLHLLLRLNDEWMITVYDPACLFISRSAIRSLILANVHRHTEGLLRHSLCPDPA
jgi:hypothetical protein